MQCAMCGYEFERSELTCHGGCPLGAHCMVICCPRCGYSTVDPARSNLTRRLMQLLKIPDEQRTQRPVAGSQIVGVEQWTTGQCVRLLDMKAGQSGHISDVGSAEEQSAENANLAHLSQYGLLPGTPVRLTQKRPVPIVQVGQTELALDQSVAANIYVDV